MKVTTFFLLCFALQSFARVDAQEVSLHMKQASLEKVLSALRKQVGVSFVVESALLKEANPVTVSFDKADLKSSLELIFQNQPIKFEIKDLAVYLSKKPLSDTRNNVKESITVINPTILQQREITGRVTDEEGNPLEGVTVSVKDMRKGTTTDVQGEYTLALPSGANILMFSGVGYETTSQNLNGKREINVTLKRFVSDLDEVVVVGYGTVRKGDLTGSIAQVDATKFSETPVVQLSDMLAGTVAGISLNQSPDAAGGGSMEIRGPNSLSAGGSPMIVLDGVIFNGSIADINPSDIETIDILKDASSAAVYGSRAASGVIHVTTKKGREGKPIVNFDTKQGISDVTNKRRGLGPDEYIQFRQDFFRTVNLNTPYHFYTHPDELPEGMTLDEWRQLSANPIEDDLREWMARIRLFPEEQENYVNGKTIDWFDQVIQPGRRQDYDLSVSGGQENVRYYLSLGYLKNEGVVVGDDFGAIRSRLNLDMDMNSWLTVGVNLQVSDRDESAVPASLGFYSNSPFGNMFDEEGNLVRLPHGHTNNPLLEVYRTSRLRKTTGLFSNLYADVKLPFNIKYRLSYQPRYEAFKHFSFTTTDKRLGGEPSDISEGTRDEYTHFEWMVDNILSWSGEFGDHGLDVTLLYNAEERKHWNSIQSNRNFAPNEHLGYHGLQFGDGPTITNDDWRSTGDALMARINYNYANKYLLTASVRRDGYSAFGQQNPHSTFPALAFAWRISDEPFFKVPELDDVKLRASWGVNGNRDIGIYSALAQISSNLWYDGSNPRTGVYNSSLANSGLRWERTESINFGADVSAFGNALSLTLDYYMMTTNDLLLERRLPIITGFSDIMSNLGELENRGFEFTVDANMFRNNENFRWTSALNFSFNRNKIARLFGDIGEYTILGETRTGEIPDFANNWFPGHAIDAIWDYNLLGIWQEHEAEEAARYGMRPGEFKGEDVDNDGSYNELYDKQFIGYTAPRYRIGFRNDFQIYGNFRASVFLRADLGHMGDFSRALNGGWENNDRRSRNVGPVPYWTPENPINDYARLDVNTSGYGGGLRVFKPRSFVRVQDVSVSYTFPNQLTDNLYLSNLRVYASARNLFTFTKWPDWDPESGTSPMPRVFTLGVNVSL